MQQRAAWAVTVAADGRPLLRTVVDAAWAITANHGGGYSYRLCKRHSKNNKDLTETCFQQNPLSFVGDKHTVIGCSAYNATACTKPTSIEIPRMTTTNGTWPAGSEWARK